MTKPLIIGIGELLWDMLPAGKQIGGAPCNFVYHAQQSGAVGQIVSAVGQDAAGDEILAVLADKGIDTRFVRRNTCPTGTVDVTLDAHGIPNYIIHEDVAWDFITLTDALLETVKQADAVCFGSLAQRNVVSRKTILALLEACKPSCLKVFDINIRQHFYTREVIEASLQRSNILKLNEDELPEVCRLLDIKGIRSERLQQLIARYHLRLIAYTLGSRGSYLVTPEEESYLLTPQVAVKDTVGAGDAFTAAMLTGLLRKKSLHEIHRKAVKISAFVCTKNGAMPEYQSQLNHKNNDNVHLSSNK
jgi:fructokinase